MARTPKKQSDEGAPVTRQFLLEVLAKQEERLETRLVGRLEATLAGRLEARIDERFRYIGALLEDMRAQNRATIEAVVSEGQTRDRRIAALRDEIVPRLDVIETVVREHTKTLGEHGQAIAELSQKVDGLSQKVARRTLRSRSGSQRWSERQARARTLCGARGSFPLLWISRASRCTGTRGSWRLRAPRPSRRASPRRRASQR